MHHDRSPSPGWGEQAISLMQRQPQLLLASSLLAGALLALFLPRRGRIPPKFAAANRGPQRDRTDQPLYHAPSAHMGATEEQVARPTRPLPGLESGAAGRTGAAYELDPGSITPG